MDRSKVLSRLRSTRFAPGDREKALADAKRIADHLKKSYHAKVIGIGSLFESPREFRSTSDIDLLVIDLPPDRFFQACEVADAMSDFTVELIPWETANDLVRQIGEQGGVSL